MVDENGSKGPEALSDETLDQIDGGLLPAVNVALGDGSVRPGVASVKPGDGSVKPGAIKGYEGWPC